MQTEGQRRYRPQPPPSMNGFGQWVQWSVHDLHERVDHMERKVERLRRTSMTAILGRTIASHWPKIGWVAVILMIERYLTGSWAGAAAALEHYISGGAS